MKPITFTLSQEQTDRVVAWKKKHYDEVHAAPGSCKDIGGAALEFAILPTGMGDNVKVRCIWCVKGTPKSEIIVTEDSEMGGFLFDDDGNEI